MKSITIGKTINLGDFQSLRVDITCEKQMQEYGMETDRDLRVRAVAELKEAIAWTRNHL